jgi:hypothetical protein
MALAFAHSSTAAITGFGRRTATAGSRPVAGRPRPRFFWFTVIDFPINKVYQKYSHQARGREMDLFLSVLVCVAIFAVVHRIKTGSWI